MATLVLSTVGTAFGGPVGAAIGALIGQSFDQQLLGQRSRGPRLGDLSVQTSSYGTQIPRIYGTMRVAGSVIWSTDLAESSQTTGAKGQPDSVYSYSVSFAVALSSRPIAGIGRIWADGKLIRDLDGLFKVPVTFRFHDGSEAQELDPLIASMEGIGTTPAYRGLALAVFENLELAEFGNRIPFITAEVTADDLPPTIETILSDASAGTIACQDLRTVVGYAAHGRSIKAAIEPLVEALAVQLRDDGAKLLTPPVNVFAVDAENELGASADESRPRYVRDQAALNELPTTLRLAYYDPARDYQSAETRASVSDQERAELGEELPAVLAAEEAKAVAHERLARAWSERDRLTVRLPTRRLMIEPGAILELPLNPGLWLVYRSTIEAFACVLELRPAWEPAAPLAADAGRMLERNVPTAELTLALFEAPPMTAESSEPTVLLAASSPGREWKSTQVEVGYGAHGFAERTARRKAVLGRALHRTGVDADSIDIELVDHDQWLVSCDDQALAEGANLALLGSEVIQFADAEPVARGIFRLSGLVRGRARTEWACGSHREGEFFVLLERDALRPISIPRWLPGSEIVARAAVQGGLRECTARLTGDPERHNRKK